MARKKNGKLESQSLETRQHILEAAVSLFARQGYHKTTVTDLAGAIELTTGAIYHHFPSKEALLEASVDWLARGMAAYTQITDEAGTGSIATVREIVELMCRHFKRSPEATICLAALAAEFGGSHHPMAEKIKEVYRIFIEGFSRILANHPGIRDPEAAAIAFVGSVQGIAIQCILREDEMGIDELAEAFLSMLAVW